MIDFYRFSKPALFLRKSLKTNRILLSLISCIIVQDYINLSKIVWRRNNASLNFWGGKMLNLISVLDYSECPQYTPGYISVISNFTFHDKKGSPFTFWLLTLSVAENNFKNHNFQVLTSIIKVLRNKILSLVHFCKGSIPLLKRCGPHSHILFLDKVSLSWWYLRFSSFSKADTYT